MKMTKKRFQRIIKEEAYDCYKDYRAGSLTYQEYQDCLKRYEDLERAYTPSRRKTTYVGADANQDKIAAVQAAMADKPNNFLRSILSQLEAGRGLSGKQKSIVKRILAKKDPEAAKMFEAHQIRISKKQLKRIIVEACALSMGQTDDPPADHSPAGNVPSPEDYETVKVFMRSNPDLVDLGIGMVMDAAGASCERSTAQAIIDHLKDMVQGPAPEPVATMMEPEVLGLGGM